MKMYIDQAWDDWSNDEEEQEESQCLFCPHIFPKPIETFQHIKNEHGFDFQAVKRELGLDFYKCIRMINYIREQVRFPPFYIHTIKNSKLFKY